MDKVKQFFSKVGDFFKMIKEKIFRRQAEEEKNVLLTKKVVIGIIVALVVIGAGWYLISKFWLQPKSDDASVTKPLAEAKVTIIGSNDCGKSCWDTQLFLDALTAQNIKIVGQKKYSIGGWWPFNGANKLVKDFQITKVPTVIIEFTGKDKPDISKFFSPTLGNAVNGKFVLTKILAPYYDIASKQLKGKIQVTYLTDSSCAECYDVNKHVVALRNLGVESDGSKTTDISSDEGKALISQYKITKVPTVLISGEVAEYTVLSEAWSQVGTIAADGTYIFTAVDLMGDSYKNLTTGKIIKAVEPAAATAPATTPKQ